MGKSRKYNIKQ